MIWIDLLLTKLRIPKRVGSKESVGRQVFSRRMAKRSKKGRIPHRVFLYPKRRHLSVDRLTIAPRGDILEVAYANATKRHLRFHGWAQINVEDAQELGCRVAASPVHNNPWHADIVLPDDVVERRDAHRELAHELAKRATWVDVEEESPAGTTSVEGPDVT